MRSGLRASYPSTIAVRSADIVFRGAPADHPLRRNVAHLARNLFALRFRQGDPTRGRVTRDDGALHDESRAARNVVLKGRGQNRTQDGRYRVLDGRSRM